MYADFVFNFSAFWKYITENIVLLICFLINDYYDHNKYSRVDVSGANTKFLTSSVSQYEQLVPPNLWTSLTY